MGGGAGRGAVVQRGAFVEERRFRRVEIFGRRVGIERTAAERNHPAAEIGDRKHDALAEPVVRHRHVLTGDEQAGLDHVLDRNALLAEVLLQGKALRGRIAEAELELGRRVDAAVGKVAACPRARARGKRGFEKFCRKLKNVVQRLALVLARLVVGRRFGQRQAGHGGKPLHRLREAHALGLHHEIENGAVLAGGEIEPGLFLVVDEERGGPLFVERRQALPLAAGLLQLHAAAHHLRDGEAGAQFIEEFRRKTHGPINGRITRKARSRGSIRREVVRIGHRRNS